MSITCTTIRDIPWCFGSNHPVVLHHHNPVSHLPYHIPVMEFAYHRGLAFYLIEHLEHNLG